MPQGAEQYATDGLYCHWISSVVNQKQGGSNTILLVFLSEISRNTKIISLIWWAGLGCPEKGLRYQNICWIGLVRKSPNFLPISPGKRLRRTEHEQVNALNNFSDPTN